MRKFALGLSGLATAPKPAVAEPPVPVAAPAVAALPPCALWCAAATDAAASVVAAPVPAVAVRTPDTAASRKRARSEDARERAVSAGDAAAVCAATRWGAERPVTAAERVAPAPAPVAPRSPQTAPKAVETPAIAEPPKTIETPKAEAAPKPPRPAPADSGLFRRLLNEAGDEKQVCVFGVPPVERLDDRALLRLVTDELRARSRNGCAGAFEPVAAFRVRTAQGTAFVKFARPEGAANLIALGTTLLPPQLADPSAPAAPPPLRSQVTNGKTRDGAFAPALTYRRPKGFPEVTRPWSAGTPTELSSDRRRGPTIVEVSGTDGGLRNLQRHVSDADFVHVLEYFGPVVAFQHKRDSEGNSKAGRAVVDFATEDAALRAMAGLDGNIVAKPTGNWVLAVARPDTTGTREAAGAAAGMAAGDGKPAAMPRRAPDFAPAPPRPPMADPWTCVFCEAPCASCSC